MGESILPPNYSAVNQQTKAVSTTIHPSARPQHHLIHYAHFSFLQNIPPSPPRQFPTLRFDSPVEQLWPPLLLPPSPKPSQAPIATCKSFSPLNPPTSISRPVWHKFVYPPFSEVLADQKEETGQVLQGDSKPTIADIDFKDDDGEALLLLLRVAHFKFADIPSKLSFERLLNVAILCDEYDCVNLVRPWLSKWFAYKDVTEDSVAPEEGHEDYLFIAWVFGRQEIFNKLAKKLLLEVEIAQGKRLECLTSSKAKLSQLIPQGLADNFLKIRRETITKLLEVYSRIPYEFEDKKCLQGKEECNIMMYGTVMLALMELGAFHKKGEAHNYLGSINVLSLPFRGIYDRKHIITGHLACDGFILGLRRKVWQIMRDIPDPVLPLHREHFTDEPLCLID
ncbi:hypothetical protein LCER1_G008236 [Lachnellula cervina]|uniref:Uncharacterized protein n=1 Tax=Lachnellula cervina TaxID=1316786 RepID=A0A7D8YHE6_9HELO|nr:hypothetical protein LCER1_G008236 [Lachnellula cervina]